MVGSRTRMFSWNKKKIYICIKHIISLDKIVINHDFCVKKKKKRNVIIIFIVLMYRMRGDYSFNLPSFYFFTHASGLFRKKKKKLCTMVSNGDKLVLELCRDPLCLFIKWRSYSCCVILHCPHITDDLYSTSTNNVCCWYMFKHNQHIFIIVIEQDFI